MLASREIGRSGLKASILGLGCNSLGWVADERTSLGIVHAALDAGITFFDTADVYGRRGDSERFLGKALGSRRKDVLIATKFGAPMRRGDPVRASGDYVRKALDASLARLGTDWVDLYQLHWHDPATPIAETMAVLGELMSEGKIRAVGCCNLTSTQFLSAQRAARELGVTPFVSLQAAYSLVERQVEQDVLPALRAEEVSLIPYFPLAGGLLTDKYATPSDEARGRLDTFAPHRERFLSEATQRELAQYRRAAEERGWPLLAYSLKWLAARPGVATIIAGASEPKQVHENVAALCGD